MKTLIQSIPAQSPFALATVISRNGSAPRTTGAKMLVRADGSTLGTVGGGSLENRVQRLAQEMVAARQEPRGVVRSFVFNGKDAASMDSICGGNVEVLVEWLDPAEEQTAAVIAALANAAETRRPAWLVSTLPPQAPCKGVVGAGGVLAGELPQGITEDQVRALRLPAVRGEVLIEPLDIGGTAYIFGAGHVSRALAEFVHAVGFYTVVLDDRAEYANRERFPNVDEVVVLPNYENLHQQVALDEDSFVVIITRGHLDDQVVLEQLLKTPPSGKNPAYIGMIGSRRKVILIFNGLRQAGFSEEDIQRVHAPIGLAINAETPEEIGISIVAQMIQERAGTIRHK